MDSKPQSSALICGIEHRADKVFILVRCEEGPIKVGDVFNELRTVTFHGDTKEIEVRKSSPRAVQIKLLSIEFYGRSVSELHSGSTARFEVTGSEIEHLKKHEELAIAK